jgi:hypothetical protein
MNGVPIMGPEDMLREEIRVTETTIKDQEMMYRLYCDGRNALAKAIMAPKNLKQTGTGWRIESASRVVLAIEEHLVRELVKKQGENEMTRPYIEIMQMAAHVRNQCSSSLLVHYEAYKAIRRPEDYERAREWLQRMRISA